MSFPLAPRMPIMHLNFVLVPPFGRHVRPPFLKAPTSSFFAIGSYKVTVALQGFRSVEKDGVVVELNKNTVSDFVLEPSAVSEKVEVRAGEIPLIDTTGDEVQSSLNELHFEATPLPVHNFITMLY